MLTFAYGGRGGARGHTYVIIIWKKMLNNLHNLPNLNKSRNWKEFCSFLEFFFTWCSLAIICTYYMPFLYGGGGSIKPYVILMRGHAKCLLLMTRGCGGIENPPKLAYVIHGCSPKRNLQNYILWFTWIKPKHDDRLSCWVQLHFLYVKVIWTSANAIFFLKNEPLIPRSLQVVGIFL